MSGQMFMKTLFYALTGYAMVCMIVFFIQRRMLYFPQSYQLPEKQIRELGLTYWPAKDQYNGFLFDNTQEDAKGTVIVFHGNAGSAYDRLFYAQALSRQNLRVILAEYPGYGGRPGSPSESVLVDDAVQTIQKAEKQFKGPVYVWGESLGCGVAASAMPRVKDLVDGLVLFLPWDSLPNVAKTHYWYLPVRWLIKDKYNSVENLKQFKKNTAVLLAGKDEIIPVKHGRRLYDSLTMKKRLWIFEEATHNDMPVSPRLSWWKEVIDFLSDDH